MLINACVKNKLLNMNTKEKKKKLDYYRRMYPIGGRINTRKPLTLSSAISMKFQDKRHA